MNTIGACFWPQQNRAPERRRPGTDIPIWNGAPQNALPSSEAAELRSSAKSAERLEKHLEIHWLLQVSGKSVGFRAFFGPSIGREQDDRDFR